MFKKPYIKHLLSQKNYQIEVWRYVMDVLKSLSNKNSKHYGFSSNMEASKYFQRGGRKEEYERN